MVRLLAWDKSWNEAQFVTQWQTRWVQVLVRAISCRFKSCYPHQVRAIRTAGLLFFFLIILSRSILWKSGRWSFVPVIALSIYVSTILIFSRSAYSLQTLSCPSILCSDWLSLEYLAWITAFFINEWDEQAGLLAGQFVSERSLYIIYKTPPFNQLYRKTLKSQHKI